MVDRQKVAENIVRKNAQKAGMTPGKRIFKKNAGTIKPPKRNVYEQKK